MPSNPTNCTKRVATNYNYKINIKIVYRKYFYFSLYNS